MTKRIEIVCEDCKEHLGYFKMVPGDLVETLVAAIQALSESHKANCEDLKAQREIKQTVQDQG